MGKHSDFRISSFQVEDAWRILQFNRKTEKYFKEFMRTERWICKIAVDPGHLLLLLLLLFFSLRRIENDWRLKLTKSDISDSKLLDFLDQNEKIWKYRILHGGEKIWILFSSSKTIIYERAQRVSKILFLPQENKIHIFKPSCNVLFIIWTKWHR